MTDTSPCNWPFCHSSSAIRTLTPDRRLCLSPNLGQSFLLLKTNLLPQPQNLEPLEVGESPSLCALVSVLSEGGLLPLLVYLLCLPFCCQWTMSDAAWNLVQNERSECDVGELSGVTGNGLGLVFRGTVYEDLFFSEP
jgi:hypothetical protein